MGKVLNKDIKELSKNLKHFDKEKRFQNKNILLDLKILKCEIKNYKFLENLYNMILIRRYNMMEIEPIDDSFRKIINNMCENHLCLLNLDEEKDYTKTEITIKDAKDLTREFYNHFDSNLDKEIVKLLSPEHMFFLPKNEYNFCGMNLFNHYSGKSYIKIYYDSIDIETVMTMIHEIMHAISMRMGASEVNNFKEVASTSLERIFMEYMLDKNLFTNDINNIIFDKYIDLSNQLFTLRKNNINIDIVDYDYNETIDLLNEYAYALADVFSYYYVDLYRNNKKNIKQVFYDFIKCIKLTNDLDLIYGYERLDEIITGEYLEKDLKLHLKKY